MKRMIVLLCFVFLFSGCLGPLDCKNDNVCIADALQHCKNTKFESETFGTKTMEGTITKDGELCRLTVTEYEYQSEEEKETASCSFDPNEHEFTVEDILGYDYINVNGNPIYFRSDICFYIENKDQIEQEKQEYEENRPRYYLDSDTHIESWETENQHEYGAVIYMVLNENGKNTRFDYPITVEVHMGTIEPNDAHKIDRIVYLKNFTINNWEEVNLLYDTKLKIPFEEINTTEGDYIYGRIWLTAYLPDGEVISSISQLEHICNGEWNEDLQMHVC